MGALLYALVALVVMVLFLLLFVVLAVVFLLFFVILFVLPILVSEIIASLVPAPLHTIILDLIACSCCCLGSPSDWAPELRGVAKHTPSICKSRKLAVTE